MEREKALDDLRVIRQVMERTRRASSTVGGWFMLLWGVVWLVGFLGNQFLCETASNWTWAVLDALGALVSFWLVWRERRHGRVRSNIGKVVTLWWLALFAFDVLLIGLLRIRDGRDVAMLIILTIALGYVQFGLFTHWSISVIGATLALLTVLAALFLSDYFYAVVAVLGGALLIGSGLRASRQSREG